MPRRRSHNEGTIYQKKDGLWYAQVSLDNGKRITRYFPTQKEARNIEQQYMARLYTTDAPKADFESVG